MAKSNLIAGGKADKRKPSDFDSAALKAGIKVEMEHTDNPDLAREIAMDHLTESKDYYKELAKMEAKLEKSEKEPNTKAIASWLAKHPNPDDSAVHAFAEKNGMEVDDVEEAIYRMASSKVKKSMSGLDALGDILQKADEGGWERGPRGGKRRRKGKGWEYYREGQEAKPKGQMELPLAAKKKEPTPKGPPKTIADVRTDVLEDRLAQVNKEIDRRQADWDAGKVGPSMKQAETALAKWKQDKAAIVAELKKRGVTHSEKKEGGEKKGADAYREAFRKYRQQRPRSDGTYAPGTQLELPSSREFGISSEDARKIMAEVKAELGQGGEAQAESPVNHKAEADKHGKGQMEAHNEWKRLRGVEGKKPGDLDVQIASAKAQYHSAMNDYHIAMDFAGHKDERADIREKHKTFAEQRKRDADKFQKDVEVLEDQKGKMAPGEAIVAGLIAKRGWQGGAKQLAEHMGRLKEGEGILRDYDKIAAHYKISRPMASEVMHEMKLEGLIEQKTMGKDQGKQAGQVFWNRTSKGVAEGDRPRPEKPEKKSPSEMTPKEQASEFQRRRNMPGVEVKYMTAGRASDVVLTLKGKTIAQKTTISTRGKEGEPSFLLPDLEKSMDGLDALGDLLQKALPKAGAEGGSKTPPKEYREGGATKGKHYADPKNYKYPIDTEEHVRAAISYFSKPKNAGVYSESEQKSIWSRIRSAAKKFGISVSEKSGPPSVERMEKSLYGMSFSDRLVGTPYEAAGLKLCKERVMLDKERDKVFQKYRIPWEKRQGMDPVELAKHRKAEEKAMEGFRKRAQDLDIRKDELEMKYLDWRIEQAESSGEMRKALPSASADISPEKARQILHDGEVHGKPLTEQQRKFFGAIGGHLPAPGKKGKTMKKADDGKPGESLEETSLAELRNTYQDIQTRLKQKPDDKALQARAKAIGAELKRRGTDKGEGMLMRKSDGLDDLGDVLNKAGLPTHNWAELGHAKSSTVDGGSADGGELDQVGKTSGSGDSAPGPGQNTQGQLTGVPSPKGDKFSEDDAEDEDQMKPHKKALERSLQKGMTPANQRESVAHEAAVVESQLRKGQPDVQVGDEPHPYSMSAVHGNTDRIAAGLLEDSFYHGRPPSLAPDGSVMRKSILCKSCGDEYSAMLTACPGCSHGTTANRLLPDGGWVGDPTMTIEKGQSLLRKPPEEPDLYMPGVVETEE